MWSAPGKQYVQLHGLPDAAPGHYARLMNRRGFLKTSIFCASAAGAALPFGAASAATAQSPRPSFPTGSRLVFIGDSITDMKWGRNEKDRNHYLGHSFVFLIAARLGVEMPEAKLEFFNRGKSGNKVADLKTRWQKDAIAMEPDVLTVLIGVNDVSQSRGAGVDLVQWEADYRNLLTRSRKANPRLRLVLLDPFVLRVGRLEPEQTWNYWRGLTDQQGAIVARLAAEFNAAHVRTQEIFDRATALASAEHWIWDGVHPLPQGHELIARNWIERVSARWGRN